MSRKKEILQGVPFKGKQWNKKPISIKINLERVDADEGDGSWII
jgi:hypothetical protein